jgi:hypothetical protein
VEPRGSGANDAEANSTECQRVCYDLSRSAPVESAGDRALSGFALSQRRSPEELVEYAIADLWQLQQYRAAFDSDDALLRSSLRLINRLTRQRQYGILSFSDGVIVLQKDRPSDPAARAAWQMFRQHTLEQLE